MIGRAGRGADGAHFFNAEFHEAFGIEKRFGLLIEEGLVGRASALRHEEEFVFCAGGGVEVDLGGEVGLGVDLLEHRFWRDLGVAKIFLLVGFVNAGREGFGIVDSGEDAFAFFAHDDGGAGVLAAGEDTVTRDLGIFEKHERDHAVVFGGFGVVEDGRDLFEVRGPKFEGDGLDRFVGKHAQGLRIDFENFLSFELTEGDQVGRNFFVFGGIWTEGEGHLVMEFVHDGDFFRCCGLRRLRCSP